MSAGTAPLLLFAKQTVEVAQNGFGSGRVLVGQNYFNPAERTEVVGGEKVTPPPACVWRLPGAAVAATAAVTSVAATAVAASAASAASAATNIPSLVPCALTGG